MSSTDLPSSHSHDPRALYPVFSMLAGATMWGVIWYPMRLLQDGGLQGPWLALILYATAFLVSLPWTARRIPEFARRPWWMLLLVLSTGWTNVSFIEAVLHGNVLRILLLFYLAPLWATLLGWLVLRERISSSALAALALAMAGALTMLWNSDFGAPWPQDRYDWLAISSGFAFALSNVAARSMQDVSVMAKTMGVWVGVAFVAFAAIGLFALPVPQASTPVLGGVVALALGGVILMTALVQYGVTHLPVHRSAVIALFELVAGAISQQLLTDETVTLREWVGGGLIVIAAYLAARATRHT